MKTKQLVAMFVAFTLLLAIFPVIGLQTVAYAADYQTGTDIGGGVKVLSIKDIAGDDVTVEISTISRSDAFAGIGKSATDLTDIFAYEISLPSGSTATGPFTIEITIPGLSNYASFSVYHKGISLPSGGETFTRSGNTLTITVNSFSPFVIAANKSTGSTGNLPTFNVGPGAGSNLTPAPTPTPDGGGTIVLPTYPVLPQTGDNSLLVPMALLIMGCAVAFVFSAKSLKKSK